MTNWNKNRILLVAGLGSLIASTLLGLSGAKAQNLCQEVLAFDSMPESTEQIVPIGEITSETSMIRHQAHGYTDYEVTHGIFTSRGPRSRGLQMAYDYRLPKIDRIISQNKTPPVFILLHGVADSRDDLAGLTHELEKRGARILRVDTLGHGQTAKLPANQKDKFEPIDYRADVEMVIGLARTLGIQETIVIGHSKGGGLSMDISRELKSSGIKALANIPIAPYLSAIDKWMVYHTLAEDPALFKSLVGRWDMLNQSFADNALRFGWSGAVFSLTYNRFYDFWKTAFNAQKQLKQMAVDMILNSYAAELGAALSDPIVHKMMHTMYTKYHIIKNKKLPLGKRKTDAEIELLVQGAIAATVGIRDLNFQTKHNATPLDPDVPTLVITGAKDDVVKPAQVEDHQEFVKNQGYTNFVFHQIPRIDHFLPQRKPKLIVEILIDFLITGGIISETP